MRQLGQLNISIQERLVKRILSDDVDSSCGDVVTSLMRNWHDDERRMAFHMFEMGRGKRHVVSVVRWHFVGDLKGRDVLRSVVFPDVERGVVQVEQQAKILGNAGSTSSTPKVQ